MNKLYAIRVALERTLQAKPILVCTWMIDCDTKKYLIGTNNDAFYNAQVCKVALFNDSTSPELNYFPHTVIFNDETIEKYIHKKPNDFVQELKAIHELKYPFFLTTNPSVFYNVLRNIPTLLSNYTHIHKCSIESYQHDFLKELKKFLSNKE